MTIQELKTMGDALEAVNKAVNVMLATMQHEIDRHTKKMRREKLRITFSSGSVKHMCPLSILAEILDLDEQTARNVVEENADLYYIENGFVYEIKGGLHDD